MRYISFGANKIFFLTLLTLAAVIGALIAPTQAQALYGVYGWGENNVGQLAFPAGGNHVMEPIGLPPLSQLHNTRGGIVRLYSGIQHNIAIMADGSVFAWGAAGHGQVGTGGIGNLTAPQLVTLLTTLSQQYGIDRIYTGQNHNIALLENGEVWVWGRNNYGQLGLGPGVASQVNTPVRNDDLTHINQNYGIELVRTGSNFNHLLTGTGVVYGWGHGSRGHLGNGTSLVNLLVPTPIDQLTNLHATRGIAQWDTAGFNSAIVTDCGRVYVWGNNTGGRNGLSPSGSGGDRFAPYENPTLSPVGMDPNRGIDRLYMGYESGMIITNPHPTTGFVEVWAWGINGNGAIGNNTTANVVTPARVTLLENLFNNPNYISVTRAHKNQNTANWLFIAHNPNPVAPAGSYTVYGWGAGEHGRNGNGTTDNLLQPTPIDEVTALANRGMQFFLTGRGTFAFEPAEVILVGLRKTLQMPEGTTPPDGATFYFQFTPRQIQLSDDPVVNSRPVGQIPPLSQNPVPVTLTGVDAVTANTVTMVSTLSLMDIFGVLTFPGGGVFVWDVHEIPGSSGLTDLPNFEVLYDPARFQIRVHATTAGIVGTIEVFELTYVNGSWIVASDDCKVGGLEFLNTYRRLTGTEPCPYTLNGIEITKRIGGAHVIHADLSTPFVFTLTLTEHFLAPLTFPINAYRIPVTGAPIPIPITSAVTPNITLLHGEDFVIPQIWAGTNFAVSEAAVENFIPSFRMTIGGVQDANETVGAVNTALATGNHIVWDTGRNAADYINRYQHTPPTGLFVTTAPWIALAVTATLLLAMLASNRNRKKIEELPMVF